MSEYFLKQKKLHLDKCFSLFLGKTIFKNYNQTCFKGKIPHKGHSKW